MLAEVELSALLVLSLARANHNAPLGTSAATRSLWHDRSDVPPLARGGSTGIMSTDIFLINALVHFLATEMNSTPGTSSSIITSELNLYLHLRNEVHNPHFL